MIQTENRSTTGFQTFDKGPFILSLKRTIEKKFIATIFNPLMPGGNKIPYTLNQTCSWKLQICLSVYDLLVTPGMKIG